MGPGPLQKGPRVLQSGAACSLEAPLAQRFYPEQLILKWRKMHAAPRGKTGVGDTTDPQGQWGAA